MKIAILFGGKSSEHDISIKSATSIIFNLDNSKYDIYLIYIGKDGLFYKCDNIRNLEEIKKISNIIEYLENIDVVFPVLHGKYGEDGSIQGFLETINKKYVGCKVLSSSICMDKIYAKMLFEKAGINTAEWLYIKKKDNKYLYIDKSFEEYLLNKEELIKLVEEKINFPVFIKPSREGSSFGVNKAKTKDDVINYLEEAFKYDEKVLVEKDIIGKEVECAILENNEILVSEVGEILSGEEFYSFSSKYKNKNSKTIIPANINTEISNEIKAFAQKAYKLCDCKGLARIDFFIEKDTNKIYLNEINTLPGFTEISMYPKLIEDIGITYSELLDRLINLSIL